jgi:hypothetical protein
MRSTHRSAKPPTMNIVQTMRTSKRCALINEAASAPITAAGRKAMSTPMTKRAAAHSVNMCVASYQMRPK